MKTCLRTLLVACCATLGSLTSYGQTPFQTPFLTFHLDRVPPLAPGDVYAVALSDMGLNKTNYSVLAKVSLPGDTLHYIVPGTLPTGDSFCIKVKPGGRMYSDSLYIIHRGGESTVVLMDVIIMVFHPKIRMSWGQSNRNFIQAVVSSYYSENTRRNVSRETAATQLSEKKLPGLFPALSLFPTKQSQMVSFRGEPFPVR